MMRVRDNINGKSGSARAGGWIGSQKKRVPGTGREERTPVLNICNAWHHVPKAVIECGNCLLVPPHRREEWEGEGEGERKGEGEGEGEGGGILRVTRTRTILIPATTTTTGPRNVIIIFTGLVLDPFHATLNNHCSLTD